MNENQLAIVKGIGILLTGVSAVWVLLVEADTGAKHRARKYLLSLAVLGGAMAVLAQIGDSWKTKRDDEQAQRRTERLLTRIDYISMDATILWPIQERALSRYRERLQGLIKAAEMDDPAVTEESHGLRVTGRTEDKIDIFTFTANSEAFPIRADGTAYQLFNSAAHPHITIFKSAPDDKTLKALAESSQEPFPQADMTLIPQGGERRMLVVPSHPLDAEEPFRIGDQISGLEVPKNMWAQSGSVLSTADLPGATAVIKLAATLSVQKIWKPSSITLYFNGQRTYVDARQLKEFRGSWRTLYVFTFPQPH
jgi:hypothetical protein